MKRRTERRPDSQWCPVRRTKDPRLDVQCAYGSHQMHLHTGQVLLAQRGIAQAIICERCAKPNRLVVAWDGKRWELARQDQGTPPHQPRLDSKIWPPLGPDSTLKS